MAPKLRVGFRGSRFRYASGKKTTLLPQALIVALLLQGLGEFREP